MNKPENVLADLSRHEQSATATDLKTKGWQPALHASQQRLSRMTDLIASTVPAKLACQSGCWYCCYFKVDVRAEDVFQIVDFVSRHFDSERLALLKQKLADNAAILRSLPRDKQFSANLKCAFLQDGQCAIYDVRPTRCRTFHATDVAGCRHAYEEPDNLQIPDTLVPELLYTSEAHLGGRRAAFADAGYDSSIYELNSALDMALTDSRPRSRFEKYKRAFAGIAQEHAAD